MTGFLVLLEVSGAYSAERVVPDGMPPEYRRSPDDASSFIIEPMTVADVAARLGCGERNVRALAGRRTLRGTRTPKGWRFAIADVDAYRAGRDR